MGGEKEQEVACARLLCGHHTSGAPLQEAGGVHEVHERDDWWAVRGLSPLVHLFSDSFLTPPELEHCTDFCENHLVSGQPRRGLIGCRPSNIFLAPLVFSDMRCCSSQG